MEHAREHPDESLGVIAFGSDHAENIDNALRSRLRDETDDHLDSFFAEDAPERFFVKNIERVQGDERDVIILSVGYHKAQDGSLPYRFGPLNQQGGERRLNVAITRARSRLHLVSSFSHHDMDPGKSTARGVELLRQYLAFADSGGDHLEEESKQVPLNAFELDVMNRLTDRGIPVIPQYGVAGYRIDFACQHPDYPGIMVLAIEADGASYHSGFTARERDRLRQENLEDKGMAVPPNLVNCLVQKPGSRGGKGLQGMAGGLRRIQHRPFGHSFFEATDGRDGSARGSKTVIGFLAGTEAANSCWLVDHGVFPPRVGFPG